MSNRIFMPMSVPFKGPSKAAEGRLSLLGVIVLSGLLGLATLGLDRWALVIIPVAVITWLSIQKLFYALLFLVCFLPPEPGDADIGFIGTMWYIAFSVFWAAWLVKLITQPKKIFLPVSYLLLCGGFLATCILSLYLGADIHMFLTSQADRKLYAQNFVLRPLLDSLLFFPVVSAIENPRQLKQLFWAIVLAGIFHTIPVYFVGGVPESATGEVFRRSGLMATAPHAAFYTMFFLIAATSLYGCETSKRRKGFLIGAIVLFVLAQHFTKSKTVLASLILTYLLFILLQGKADRILKSLIVSGLSFLIALPFLPTAMIDSIKIILLSIFVDPNINALTSSNIGSLGGRLLVVQAGLKLFWTYPVFGVGLGKHFFLIQPFAPPMYNVIHTHYVTVLVEMGLVGLALFLGIIGLTLWDLTKSFFQFKRQGDPQMYSLSRGLLLTFFGMLIVYLTLFDISSRVFWMIVGLAPVVRKMTRGGER